MAFSLVEVQAHGSWQKHADDVREVLGLQKNEKLDGWIRFISSDMIDKRDFHEQLKREYGLTMKHRLLFHWAYDAEPWSADIEKIIIDYCDWRDLNQETHIRMFKGRLRREQRERNKKILQKTEETFGLSHGGRDRTYSRFLASMAYNIHILGDYTTDNSDLDGLYDFNRLVGQIIEELKKLDSSLYFVKLKREINQINSKSIGVQEKADELMAYMKKSVPGFIQKADQGNLKRGLEKNGYTFQTVGLLPKIRM